MRRLRNVKIVATLGPASSDYDTIRALFDAGADVFRLNMSHGEHAEIGERHRIIRQVEADVGRPIAILADLQGPKLRVGSFANGAEELAIGQAFRLDLDPSEGDATRVCLPHREIFDALIPVTDDESIATAQALAHKEGIFTGISGGGTFAAALKAAKDAPEGSVLLAMLPDTAERYLSTPLFADVAEGSDDDWLTMLSQ